MGKQTSFLLRVKRKTKREVQKILGRPAPVKKRKKIMLLTNRDSDNAGDQVIEACDIALLKAVEKNLNLPDYELQINSYAASTVSQQYLRSRDEKDLESAKKRIQDADVVVFGGAPQFNYLYQNFYERTAVTIELAQRYGKPVLFSAIGIERYDEDNERCQRLKDAVNLSCVKMITTRDGMEHLEKYKKEADSFVTAKVSDPAVFTGKVFEKYLVSPEKRKGKKIGIFILRANGFVDNHYNFTKEQAAGMWLELMQILREKGYEYELVTSGHFGDEAFLDYLIREYGVSLDDCVFNINTPESLVERISGYDGVISCRMHPSIVSFALDVPAIGIEWNPKVKYFYKSIGYADRVVPVEDLNAPFLVQKLEQAMAQGIKKDKDYLVSVYRYLYMGIRDALELSPPSGTFPYTYDELMEAIQPFAGTSEAEKERKLRRKFRRAYALLNTRLDDKERLKKELSELKEQLHTKEQAGN